MFDFLERLRQKSPEARFLITVGTAGVITGVIAIVWGVSFASTLSKGNIAAPIASDSLDELRTQFETSVEEGKHIITSLDDFQIASSTASADETSTDENLVGTSTTNTRETGNTTATSTKGKKESPKPVREEDGIEVISI